MLNFILRRILLIPFMVIVISVLVFTIIQLPPGNFVENHVASLASQGTYIAEEQMEDMIQQYGLDQPLYVQYWRWVKSCLRGDFGWSFTTERPVREVVAERLPFTIVLSLSTLLFTWIVAFIIGTYTATHQYSIGDYIASFVGFVGLATPNFMLALVLMWIFYVNFGFTVGGLFSPEMETAAWSLAKLWDLIKHLIIPIIVIGTAGTAGSIRLLRANLLDELSKPYVITAEAKGVGPVKRLFKYPLRIALIPFTSTVGWKLPRLISGAAIVSIVLSLRTTGPMLLKALKTEDMFMAGSFLLLLSFLTIIGTLISDILLAWLDPRIRYEE